MIALFISLLLLPLLAGAGEFETLLQMVEKRDQRGAEAWLSRSTRESGDPLETLSGRAVEDSLEQQTTQLFADEAVIEALTFAWVKSGNESTRQDLLKRLASSTKSRSTIEQAVAKQRRQAPQADIRFIQLFTAGIGRDGELAKASNQFPLTTSTIHLRYEYEHGIPGEKLTAKWYRLDTASKKPFASASAKLQKRSDKGQFSFTPDKAGWRQGLYRVVIEGRGRSLTEVDFVIGLPQPAKLPEQLITPLPVQVEVASIDFSVEENAPKLVEVEAAPRPRVATSRPPQEVGVAPEVKRPKVSAATTTPKKSVKSPPVPAIKIVDAYLAKKLGKKGPKGKSKKFSNAWRRLVLWAKIDAPQGGGNHCPLVSART
ncbi:hypothetical protein BOW53_00875 [Solemya pervernicosa gill symbiont]|uniref:Uncharacterized protein n=1 Tax=Solemya pervernicosa gill symbiont TaxID=642797 RepID=A0A1T2LAU0_9GAMM|nr:hypothetical protein BOW53_00875 [Solemya pervernicosa gill symbiont]